MSLNTGCIQNTLCSLVIPILDTHLIVKIFVTRVLVIRILATCPAL